MVALLLAELDHSTAATDPQLRALRTRMLVISERFDTAAAELAHLPVEHAAIERVILRLSERRLDDAVEAASLAPTLHVGQHTLLTLRILGARARFEKLFGLRAGESAPVTGRSLSYPASGKETVRLTRWDGVLPYQQSWRWRFILCLKLGARQALKCWWAPYLWVLSR